MKYSPINLSCSPRQWKVELNGKQSIFESIIGLSNKCVLNDSVYRTDCGFQTKVV